MFQNHLSKELYFIRNQVRKCIFSDNIVIDNDILIGNIVTFLL